MAIQEIKTYSIDGQEVSNFTLQKINFEKACVVNKPQQLKSYSIYWIKNGKGIYNIDFKSYPFENEIIFFLSPGQVFTVDSESIKEAYLLRFTQDFYCIETHDKEISCNGVLFNHLQETPFVQPSIDDSSRLQSILALMEDELKNPNTGHYDLVQSYLKQFIICAVRIKKEGVQIQISDKETDLFRHFNSLVVSQFRKMHSVSDYAQRLGISPKSLSKHFQRIGVPKPSELIKEQIILESKRQLLYSSKNVKQIAFDLGFNDPAYFSRYFQKATQKSPLSFKNEYKNS